MSKKTSDELLEVRKKIDNLDQKLIEVLNNRARLAQQVASIKLESTLDDNKPVVFYRPEREAQVLRGVIEKNPGPLPDHNVAYIIREVMSACLALEKPQRVAYLGPEGTFTQAAARKHFGNGAVCQPCYSISEVFNQVELGGCEFGVVPVENSTEGMVTHTLDTFQNSNLRICGEVDLPIHLHLLSTKRNHHNIKEIVAHQQALAQSRMFLESKFPKAILTPVASNGVGAQMAASEEGVACIAGSMASELYSLDIVYENIEDRCNNTTRFLIVGSDLIPPSGVDKTSIIVTTHNESGALYRLLKPFHDANVNLTRIDTRPAENEKWCYVFFIEFEGHYQDDAIQNILDILTQYSQQLKILGSYPKAVF